jgi:hypothetical protein
MILATSSGVEADWMRRMSKNTNPSSTSAIEPSTCAFVTANW